MLQRLEVLCTQPDIAHSVGVVSRFLSNPKRKTLGHSEMDSQVSTWNFQNVPMFWKFQTPVSWLHRCRHGK